MNLNYNKIIPIRGDASFRKFYRKKNKHKTSIIVSANKEKEKNLLNYDAINKLLLKNLVYIGIREIDDFEKKLIKKHNIKYFKVKDIEENGIHNVMNDIYNYLDFNLIFFGFFFESIFVFRS